jgi:GTP-binding protein
VGAHLRIYYATQPQIDPPVFLFFTNDAAMIHWGYARYLENRLREKFGFVGTPIKIVFRSRADKDPNKPKSKQRRPNPHDARTTLAVEVEEPFAIDLWEDESHDDEAEVFWVRDDQIEDDEE